MKLPAKVSPYRTSTVRFGRCQAFSLVEVVIALAIFSLAILSIVGLMVEGINLSKTSTTNQAEANIARTLRADLQATPFTNWTSGTATNFYFTYGGYPTTQTSTGAGAPFYTVAMTPGAPAYPSSGTSQNSYTILATVSYPYPVNAQATTNSYFIAQ